MHSALQLLMLPSPLCPPGRFQHQPPAQQLARADSAGWPESRG